MSTLLLYKADIENFDDVVENNANPKFYSHTIKDCSYSVDKVIFMSAEGTTLRVHKDRNKGITHDLP